MQLQHRKRTSVAGTISAILTLLTTSGHFAAAESQPQNSNINSQGNENRLGIAYLQNVIVQSFSILRDSASSQILFSRANVRLARNKNSEKQSGTLSYQIGADSRRTALSKRPRTDRIDRNVSHRSARHTERRFLTEIPHTFPSSSPLGTCPTQQAWIVKPPRIQRVRQNNTIS